jgi:hypothetical protein
VEGVAGAGVVVPGGAAILTYSFQHHHSNQPGLPDLRHEGFEPYVRLGSM